MRIALLNLLRCPQTGQPLRLENEIRLNDEIKSGLLVAADGAAQYEIRDFVPRFVPQSNYADNFGMQWNKFSKTQLDSYSGFPISEKRFFDSTGWTPAEMKDKWVLDIGCGAGRFAEIAVKTGANVVALDYSSAVDACYVNLKAHPNLHIIQGDIYALPLANHSFDFVYSLGVLQHTPDVERSFFSLPPMLAENGSLCVDFYEKSWKSAMLPKYWLRTFTKRMPKQKLFRLLEKVTPFLLSVSVVVAKIPGIGKILHRAIPVANLSGEAPFTKVQLREWALLDTFDWLSPTYDNPQNDLTVTKWLTQANMKNIFVAKVHHLVGRGNK